MIVRLKVENVFNSYKLILFFSLILEISHLIVPNRAFEIYDLIANTTGVIMILLINRLIKWKKLF